MTARIIIGISGASGFSTALRRWSYCARIPLKSTWSSLKARKKPVSWRRITAWTR